MSNKDIYKQKLQILGKSRGNPIIEVLTNSGIIISPQKSLIEPLANKVVQNLSVLDGLDLVEEGNTLTFSEESIRGSLFQSDEFKESLYNHAKIKSIQMNTQTAQIVNEILYLVEEELTENLGISKREAEIGYIISNHVRNYVFFKNFTLGVGTNRFSRAVTSDFVEQAQKVLANGNMFNARRDMDGAFGMKMELRDVVGFLQIIRGDMKERTMLLTKNHDLTLHYIYNSDKENFKVELNEDGERPEPFEDETFSGGDHLMKVIDLELGKSTNPVRHVRFDRIAPTGYNNLPNFIWMDANNHYWYNLLESGMTVHEMLEEVAPYVDYKTGEIKAPKQVNPELVEGIKQSKQEIEELYKNAQIEFAKNNPNSKIAKQLSNEMNEEGNLYTDEEQKLRLYTYKQVQNALSNVTWTKYDYELYNHMLQFLKNKNIEVNKDFNPLLPENKNKIVITLVNSKNLLIILKADKTTYYITPQFMVNDLGYNVFRDRTDTIKFPRRALRLESDTKHANVLEYLLKLINKRRELSDFEILGISDEPDLRRLQRLQKIATNEYKEKYGLNEINMRFNSVSGGSNKGNISHLELILKDIEGKDVRILLSPASLLNQTSKEVYHQRKGGISTLNSLSLSLQTLMNNKVMDKKSIYIIAKIADICFDLRKNFD